MARLANASAKLGGAEAFYKMHVWLMEKGEAFNESMIPEAVAAAGLEHDAMLEALDERFLSAVISIDGKALHRAPNVGLPAVFVNEKYIPKWKVDGQPPSAVIERIFAIATAKPAAPAAAPGAAAPAAK
jgi:hypothetical protein